MRLHHLDEGQGEPILFVHGTPTSSHDWRHLVRELSATHRCVAPDLVGFGASPRPSDFAYTPEAHAGALADFVAEKGLRDLTLVVHDFGGPIALPLALDPARRVRRLIVLNSWMWPAEDDPHLASGARLLGGRLGRFLYRWANLSLRVLMPSAYADRAKLTRELRAHHLAPFRDRDARVRVLWTLARSLLASRDHFAALCDAAPSLARIPVHLVWGTRDPAFTPAALARWRALVPHATVTELPVGHWPQEEDPVAVLAALRAQLATR